jgi:hypothetical protein
MEEQFHNIARPSLWSLPTMIKGQSRETFLLWVFSSDSFSWAKVSHKKTVLLFARYILINRLEQAIVTGPHPQQGSLTMLAAAAQKTGSLAITSSHQQGSLTVNANLYLTN